MDENVIFANPQTVKPLVVPLEPSLQNIQSVNKKSESPRNSVKKLIMIIVGAVILVLLISVFILAVSKPSENPKKEQATITYWGLWEDANVFQSIVSDFEKQNPNIKISYVKQDINQYRERLLARIENNTGPDVFRFHNTWLPMVANILTPFPRNVIAKTDFEKWFYKVSQRDLTRNGAIYGIPLSVDTLSLFINADLFESAGLSVPTNWIDFAISARQLTVKDQDGKIKTAGAGVGTFGNITHAGDVISLFLVQNGSDLKNLSLNLQSAQDALSFYTSFALSDKVWDESFDSSITAFAKGDLAMYFGYSWDYFTIKALNPDINVTIHEVPHLPNRNMTIASYWAEGVSVKSKNQEAALLFIKFLAQKETEQKLFAEQSKTRAFGEPYARVDLADLLKNNPIVYPFVFQAKDSISSFFASDTHDNGLNAKSNEYLVDAINSILNGTSPQTAVDTLSKGVSQVLQQYGQ